jgi:chemotaxis protein CheZ
MAPASARAPHKSVPANTIQTSAGSDLKLLVRELAAVAEYIARLKQEIGALRIHELCGDRLPKAHKELRTVVKATASATHDIMNAAEQILGANDDSLESYHSRVEGNVLAIFEACSFQDITGQRISKVVDALLQLEQRLGRFATAVNVRDAAAPTQAEAAVLERRAALMLNGPAVEGEAIAQDEIDKLFN